MTNRLSLHVPALDELWYRRQMMEDPATMDYNRGYSLSIAGYDPLTGCIPFSQEKWQPWYTRWVHHEPERFYAYLMLNKTGEWIGEVNVHQSDAHPWHEMGIVIEGKRRGNGYATEGMNLLLRHAFEVMQVNTLHNEFEIERSAAVHIHEAAGFAEFRREGNLRELILTREQWINNQHD